MASSTLDTDVYQEIDPSTMIPERPVVYDNNLDNDLDEDGYVPPVNRISAEYDDTAAVIPNTDTTVCRTHIGTRNDTTT